MKQEPNISPGLNVQDWVSFRQRYVTEAVNAVVKSLFENLNAHRIRIETDDTNVRSIGVAERCGFVKEGHIRENKRNPDGTYSGTIFFGLLRHEFLKKKHL